MQLDLFTHSRDLMLRNDVLHALLRNDAAAARAALATLADAYPHDGALPRLERLAAATEAVETDPLPDAAAAAAAVAELEHELTPAAQQLLGAADAEAWLRPRWQRLAQRAARLPFDAQQPELHAAALHLRAADWPAAADAAARIESWRRIPAPLGWMTEARWHRDGLDAAWPLLAELAWLAPARLDALLRRLPDPRLERLKRAFDAAFEGEGTADDLAWWPAWLLTEQPALAPLLGQALPGLQSPPERALRLLLDLLHLEAQGRQRDLPEARRRLRDLQPAIFAAYLRTR